MDTDVWMQMYRHLCVDNCCGLCIVRKLVMIISGELRLQQANSYLSTANLGMLLVLLMLAALLSHLLLTDCLH